MGPPPHRIAPKVEEITHHATHKFFLHHMPPISWKRFSLFLVYPTYIPTPKVEKITHHATCKLKKCFIEKCWEKCFVEENSWLRSDPSHGPRDACVGFLKENMKENLHAWKDNRKERELLFGAVGARKLTWRTLQCLVGQPSKAQRSEQSCKKYQQKCGFSRIRTRGDGVLSQLS